MNQPINTYRGNSNLKGDNTVDYVSKEEYEFRVNEIIKCKNDINYFAENYYTIVSVDRGKELIKLYPKQKDFIKCLGDNKRVVCLASRQAGKCVSGNTLVTIRNKKTGVKETISIIDFILKNKHLLIKKILDDKFIEIIDIDDYEIETDTGWCDAKSLHKTIKYQVYILKTKSFSLECADNHIVFDENFNEVFVKDLIPNKSIIQTKNGLEVVEDIIVTDTYENMYDFELDDNTNHRYYTNNILSHNTTLCCIFALWTTLFNPDKKILIVANKEATALEIMSRIRLSYELIPNWIKCGIKVWNKGQVIFSNDSAIEGISTSADSARGKSCNILIIDECVTGDTNITIKNKITNEVKNIPISELFINNIYSLDYSNNNKKTINNYEVLTINGWSKFDGIKQSKTDKLYKLSFSDDSILKCTENHLILSESNNFIKCCDAKINDIFIDKNNNKIQLVNIELLLEEQYVYDLLNVEKNSNYITNNVNSHNCAFIPQGLMTEFFQSVYPIVSSGKSSKVFMVSTPNGVGNLFYETYEKARLGVDKEGWIPFRIDWQDIPGRDEKWKETQLASFNGDQTRFAQEFGNCAAYETVVNVYDSELNKTYDIQIGELYDRIKK